MAGRIEIPIRNRALRRRRKLWPREEARTALLQSGSQRMRPALSGNFPERLRPIGIAPSGHHGRSSSPFVRSARRFPSARAVATVAADRLHRRSRRSPQGAGERCRTARTSRGIWACRCPKNSRSFGCCASFADHMLCPARRIPGAGRSRSTKLARASEMYSSGRFDDGFEIDPREARRDLSCDSSRRLCARKIAPDGRRSCPICPNCGQLVERSRDAYQPNAHESSSPCEKGAGGKSDAASAASSRCSAARPRCQWKVDWALRWYVLKVDYGIVRQGPHRLGAPLGTNPPRDGRTPAARVSVRDVPR